MSDERFCAVILTCRECGGQNVPTGKIELGRSKNPLLGIHAWHQVRFVQHKCEACGCEEWCEEELTEASL